MKKLKRITAHLNSATAEKLKRIIKATDSNMSQVIEKAIDVYFAKIVAHKVGSWKALQDAGFIGCATGPVDLSENYKDYLTEGLAEKV